MQVIQTVMPDVFIFEPKVFGDDRGFFFESFNHKFFEEVIGKNVNFVQDNHSKSSKGVLRGLHYQLEPYAQGKLVRCIAGEVFDVAVDIRASSPSYGQWVGVNLSADNKRQLWIPEGFAHGFIVLSEVAEFVYKTTNYYHPESECGIIWDDKTININWPEVDKIVLSDKDRNQPAFSCIKKYL
ncbi:dTDP-4-dehydrorhamnose 3,5-epimerase [Enterobacteriaceae bacterium YMB-R22]|uniref:dTDP-4-dehydrorhamnose 3,5-epimerase n=1 Tax=Tenebrionicola larvae TaxID=2815733 RepID=UPI002010FA11|nr:dTDP-4-dehydrorhamnose 3,5-epimerase [Tenebrionicola larvae]MBV4412032.1 dTDP-4-dehydrorhamnose 3,5-epimerase [Tenebrionicola larvae]